MSGLCAGPTNEAIGGVSVIDVARDISVTLFCPLLSRGLLLLISADALELLLLPFAFVPIRVEDRLDGAGASLIISSTVCMKEDRVSIKSLSEKQIFIACLHTHTSPPLRLLPPSPAQLHTQHFH